MTVIENLEVESDPWESFADLCGFEKIRPHRDGQMPVGSDRAKHRGFCRANRFHSHKAQSGRLIRKS